MFTVLIQWCFLSDLSHHLYDIDVVWSYISAMKIMHNIYIYNEILFIKKSYYGTKYLIYNVLLCRHIFSVHISMKTYSYCTFFILAHWVFLLLIELWISTLIRYQCSVMFAQFKNWFFFRSHNVNKFGCESANISAYRKCYLYSQVILYHCSSCNLHVTIGRSPCRFLPH